MEDAVKLFLGRWCSQAVTAGISTGMLEAISEGYSTIESVAEKTGVNQETGYRLLRALAAVGVLEESQDRKFSLTPTGEIFTGSHPESLKNAMLWEHNRELVNAWTLLPNALQTGRHNLLAESLNKRDLWDVLKSNAPLKTNFDHAMTSYSKLDNTLVLGAYDWENSNIKKLVDIGGGLGYLVASIAKKAPSITGYVYELAETLNDPKTFIAPQADVAGRVHYVAGNMFTGENLTSSDAYIMKHILHDWDDPSCKTILNVIHKAAEDKAKLFIAEMVLPEPGEPLQPFGFLLDLEMIVGCSGRERTLKDFTSLLEATGWKFVKLHKTSGHVQLIEAIKT